MIRARLETLPDEVLMLIFHYVDEVYSLFRAVLGLNRRLNRILLDRRLHLLTNFLHVHRRDPNVDRYYNSTVFTAVNAQLAFAKAPRKERLLEQCFRSLVVFHLREQCTQLKSRIALQLRQFHAVRAQFSDDDALRNDMQLKKVFEDLHKPLRLSTLERMAALVYNRGARLEYNEHEQAGFYFAEDFHDLFASSNEQLRSCPPIITSRMLQTLFVSNPSLLQYPYYGGGHRFSIYEYLCYSIYRLQPYRSERTRRRIYQALTELILFATYCRRCALPDEIGLHKVILIILDVLSQSRPSKSNDIFVQTTQSEILAILLDEYQTADRPERIETDSIDQFKHTLDRLVATDRWDVATMLHRCPRLFLDVFHDKRSIVHALSENRPRTRLLYRFLHAQPQPNWLLTNELVFTLLEKKQRELLEKLLQSSPAYIHQVDQDGNNPLLFVCLKVSGRRYRIVELLVRVGSDIRKRNLRGVTFDQTLRLPRNRWLLYHLLKRQSVQIDRTTGQLVVSID